MKVNIREEGHMEQGIISGKTVPITMENLKTGEKTGKENGRNLGLKTEGLRLMKVYTSLIRKMDLGSSNGRLEMFMKEFIRTMKGMGKDS